MGLEKSSIKDILHSFLKRRDGRVVEGATLEMLCRGNSTVSSNLTLSAIFFAFILIYLKKIILAIIL